jgi:hypothetical protein
MTVHQGRKRRIVSVERESLQECPIRRLIALASQQSADVAE